nr:hypothetical protein [Marinicella sp. W31]MDC2876825.1 hypothetical protein [Marinicella sp. W31]
MRDDRVFMISAYGRNRFANMENSATSAANLEWYVRTCVERGGHHDDPFGFVNDAVGGVTPGPEDPMFHPFSMVVGWARISAAAFSASPAGMGKGTCCARSTRA